MRTKRVFANHSEVAHIWAQQKQTDGRASRIFFDGPSIYSYGRHFEMARFIRPDVVLFNCRRYSVSTGKHQAYTRRAVSHKTVFDVPSMTDHNENVRYLIDQVRASVAVLVNKRTAIIYFNAAANGQIKEALKYIETFRRDVRAELKKEVRGLKKYKDKTFTREMFDKKAKNEKELEKTREIRAEKQRQLRALEEAERLELWLKGEYDGSLWSVPVHLRIKGDEIQTTKGANVPLLAARELWDRVTLRKPLHGLQLGNYTVTSFDGKTLVVGCHQIPAREIFRMARALNWENNDGASLEVVS